MKFDTKRLDKLIREVSKGNKTAQVGYFEDSGVHPRSGLSAADVARIQENGSEHIPQRPWVTDGANEAHLPTQRAMKFALRKIQRGEMTVEQALRKAAEIQKFKITQVLDQAKFFYRENADSTIRTKGFNSPLLETGWIRDKIDIKIEGGK